MKGMWWQRSVSLVGVVWVIVACSHPAPEDGIREAVEQIETALAEHDNAGIREHLTADFLGGPEADAHRLDRRGVQRLLAAYFLRYKNIGVVVTAIQVKPLAHDPNQAWSEATVVLTGAEGVIPDTGRAYSVRGLWQYSDGVWELARLTWE